MNGIWQWCWQGSKDAAGKPSGLEGCTAVGPFLSGNLFFFTCHPGVVLCHQAWLFQSFLHPFLSLSLCSGDVSACRAGLTPDCWACYGQRPDWSLLIPALHFPPSLPDPSQHLLPGNFPQRRNRVGPGRKGERREGGRHTSLNIEACLPAFQMLSSQILVTQMFLNTHFLSHN